LSYKALTIDKSSGDVRQISGSSKELLTPGEYYDLTKKELQSIQQ